MEFFLVFLVCSCAFMMDHRTFIEQMNNDNHSFFTPETDFPVVSGDSGQIAPNNSELRKRTPASKIEQTQDNYDLSLKEELMAQEAKLSNQDYQKYLADSKYLEHISEKLYYLNLPKDERSIYVRSKVPQGPVVGVRKKLSEMFVLKNIEQKEIYVGMEKDLVIDSLGRPGRVEVAGNPRYENERWAYVETNTVRFVYFEGGKVIGWALE